MAKFRLWVLEAGVFRGCKKSALCVSPGFKDLLAGFGVPAYVGSHPGLNLSQWKSGSKFLLSIKAIHGPMGLKALYPLQYVN